MKDFLTLQEGKYLHVEFHIEHDESGQRFTFTHHHKNEGVYVTFYEYRKEKAYWVRHTDLYTPEDAHDFFETLVNTGRWKTTFERLCPDPTKKVLARLKKKHS